MSLYTYVANRNDLVVLMVDQVVRPRELPPMTGDAARPAALVAEVQLADCRAHPWLLEVTGLRPWLGPHVADRYEWQLSAVEGVGLDDVEMDQAVTLVVGFAANVVRSEQAVRQAEQESGQTDLEWWEANSGPLGEVMAHRDYPLAGRVGQAAGEAYQAGTRPAVASCRSGSSGSSTASRPTSEAQEEALSPSRPAIRSRLPSTSSSDLSGHAPDQLGDALLGPAS